MMKQWLGTAMIIAMSGCAAQVDDFGMSSAALESDGCKAPDGFPPDFEKRGTDPCESCYLTRDSKGQYRIFMRLKQDIVWPEAEFYPAIYLASEEMYAQNEWFEVLLEQEQIDKRYEGTFFLLEEEPPLKEDLSQIHMWIGWHDPYCRYAYQMSNAYPIFPHIQ